MLSLNEAKIIANKNFPNGKIKKSAEYNGLYLFIIFSDLPEEEEMDPFYSVNKLTGEFKEFSIFSDDNIDYIIPLFK